MVIQKQQRSHMESLEITDFKSFKGKHIIGPMKRFTAIIGPNGSGKSNLMDAISFVLGERGTNLRVRKLGDLIHGASVGRPSGTRCKVQMNFIDEHNKRHTYSRAIVSSTSSEYKVDGRAVQPKEYHQALKEINIFIKARNFLVYQGAIEQIAMQSPKELTGLIEELSGSLEKKNEYEQLKAEMQKAETEAQEIMSRRRDVAMEKKEAKAEKDQARNYQAVRDDLAAKNRDLYLAQIYAAEQNRKRAQRQLDAFTNEADEVRQRKADHEQEVTEKHQIVRQRFRELNKLESRLMKESKKVGEQRPLCMQSRQVVDHIKSKLDGAKKIQQAARKKAEEHTSHVKEAEGKLEVAQKQKAELKKRLAHESKQQKLNLNQQQIVEYRQLKNDAEKQTTLVAAKLYNLQQDQESDRAVVSHEKRKLEECNERIREKIREIEREKRHIESMKESITHNQERIEKETAELKEAEKQVRSFKEESKKLNDQLDDVVKRIADAHGDTNETRREQIRREALENLKRVFPDKVYGRLVELCTPSHKKYTIAVTKILQKHMNSIVCDTDETARLCIPYLREQRHPPETFLPLNSLEVQPLKESLRNMTDPPNVKLVYDVIQCNMPQVRKALQFACGNALVTDNANQARQLAYGADRHRAVALDGTLFQPNGVISGGGSDLKARAKRWDEQLIRKLKEEQRVLMEKLHTLQANSKRELDVEMKRRQIQSLESRTRYTTLEIKNRTQQLQSLEIKLEQYQSEIEIIQIRISDKEAQIAERNETIENAEKERSEVVDRVFQDFCERIGVKHIREYEEGELHFFQEMERQLSECDAEVSKLENELDYLRTENREAAVERETQAIKTLERELKEREKALKDETKRLAEIEEEVENLRAEVDAKKKLVEEAEAEHSTVRKEGHAVDKELQQLEKKILQQQQLISRKSSRRHDLLHECKVNVVELPLLRGSLDTLIVLDEMIVDDSNNGGSQLPSSQQADSLTTAEEIEVDFRTLNSKTKRLLEDENETAKYVTQLEKAVKEIEEKFSKLQAPATDANQRMEQVKEREQETTEECEASRRKARKAHLAFEKVKNERYRRFQEFFEPVSQRIDEIYKKLSQNESAQAFLGPANQEEPYLDGINYNCIAPGKRFRPMDNLSGGEKTIAALALLFAIHSSNPSPFFVLDEIDAALDNTNIGKVVKYIMDRSRDDVQLIVISLKEELFNKGDALVGVFPRDVEHAVMASGIVTYDMEKFHAS
ncbi:hypothetical protein M3Y94_00430900 [Aphelenchoides besseyi]|nr:hypothetical protein M3Y94_00430900 [Aphelenchoides besseyi]KAI6229479.1 Structural maintenance of chromosomes protein [Aphelenchoides besseyi]